MVWTMEAHECPNTHVQAERLMAISGHVFEDMMASFLSTWFCNESLLAGCPTFSGSSDSFGGNMVWIHTSSVFMSVGPVRRHGDVCIGEPHGPELRISSRLFFVLRVAIGRSSSAEIYTSIVLAIGLANTIAEEVDCTSSVIQCSFRQL